MLSRCAMLVLAVVVLASAALGGTVYLRDGRKLVGKVTRKDGKVKVEMALGTVVVDESEVLYASDGGPAASRPAAPSQAGPTAGGEVRLQPTVEWNITQATLPEPALFLTARKLELLAGLADTGSARRELGQWQILAHDGKRKVGLGWLSREQQRRRRDQFLEHAKTGSELARKAAYIRGTTPADKARKKRLQAQADDAMAKAALAWPDLLIRDFLIGAGDLRAGRYAQAERRFRQCVERDPLIAAFHQGRGLALAGMKQHLAALAEFVACLQLRDDVYEAIALVETGMKEVPGGYINEPIYLKAKELVGRYDPPKQQRSRRDAGVPWLMPGKIWQARRHELFTPPYDRVIAKQALAVPISADGALLVDRDAVADAAALYVQLADGQIARAEPVRRSTFGRTSQDDLPLTVIRARGVTFTPVDLEKLAALKAAQTVTIRAVNRYRQMGTQIRTGQAEVLSADADGVKLAATLLPGESLGVVLAEGALAGLLTGRCDTEAEDCGKSSLIGPAELAAWAKKIKPSLRYGASYSRGPTLKKDTPAGHADGQLFLVHVLSGEKPPTTLGK